MSLIVAASLVVSSPAFAEPQPQPPVAQPQPSTLDRAHAALHEKNPEAAIALVEPLIAKAEGDDAKDPDAACPTAAAAFLVGMMAQRNLNISVSVENDWCDSMFVKGYALSELKRYDEAAAMLGKLVRHDKSNPNYLAEYAFALRSSGQIDKAHDAYQRTKSVASSMSNKSEKRHWRAVALRGIGYIAFDREQWDVAEKAYRDSLKDEPGNAIATGELELIKQKRSK